MLLILSSGAFSFRHTPRRHRVYRWLGRILNGILIVVSVGTSGSFINFSYLSTVLRVIFGPQARMILSALFVGGTAIYAVDMLGSGQEYKAEFLGLLSAACLHVYLFAALTRRLRKAAGLRLLILRVFKIEKASSFIFSGLMRYWRHFGNHFTIADGSLVRQGYTDNLLRTIFLAFILMGALVDVSLLRLSPWIESKVQHQLSWVWDCVLVAVLALLAAWAALRIGEFRIVSKFTRSPDQVLASLRSLEATPRGLDLSFRHLQALCHKNTWFPAVREFASRADAVLMDLRGFNEERQGCKQEVNFLFDFVPLARLLFLVDSANDAEVLGGMFLDRWERLSRESPNLEVSEPVIHLFEVLDNDERNMQAILDRLLLIADPPGGV